MISNVILKYERTDGNHSPDIYQDFVVLTKSTIIHPMIHQFFKTEIFLSVLEEE